MERGEFMKKLLIVLGLISLLAGCAEVGAFRINSVPDQATVYVDGVYAGKTPYTVHTTWYNVFGFPIGDRFHLTVDKEGYKTIEKDTSVSERKARKPGGEYVSESGSLTSGLYTFSLEPLQKGRGVK
jgi:hypothetical protein